MEEINFASRLKQIREEKKVNQIELSEFLCISRSSISKWESGVASPDPEMVAKISSFFGVSSDYLLGKSDVKNPNQGYNIALAGDIEQLTDEQKQSIKSIIDAYRAKNKSSE